MSTARRRDIARIKPSDDGWIEIAFGDECVRILPDSRWPTNRDRMDFVAWLMLPVAMRRDVDLHVDAAGSDISVRNANRLAEIWSRWLPGHFHPVQVSFERTWVPEAVTRGSGDLCMYSGGVDSTYSLLRRMREGARQSLLTVHGMEYRFADEARFGELLRKTDPFATMVADRRILVRTNTSEIYKRHRVNRKGCDVGHGFMLSAMAFLYSETFGNAAIAADYRVDQQFEVFPWGTNTATNPYFNDGVFGVRAECEDVTRSDKCPLLASSSVALQALSFCVDYESRPNNCGRCQKCVRTKAMFLAATGSIPDVCIDSGLRSDCLEAFDIGKKHQRAFFLDLHETARRNGRLETIPGLQAMYAAWIAKQARGGGWRRRLRKWLDA